MKAYLRAVSVVAVCVLVLMGCQSTKTPINTNTTFANPDVIDSATQRDAIARGMMTIPDAMSKMQDTGLSHFRQDDEVVLNPDGTVFLLELGNGRKVPVFNKSMSYTKWSSLHAFAGAKMKRFFFGIGSLFGSRYDTALTNADKLRVPQGRRDGFIVDIEDMEGTITKSDAQLTALYEGKAKLQAQINAGLGMALEKHWAGMTGYIKVRDDGRVAIIGAVGGQIKEITGELVKLTPYGTANSLGQTALKALVKEDGSAEATEVTVTPPTVQ